MNGCPVVGRARPTRLFRGLGRALTAVGVGALALGGSVARAQEGASPCGPVAIPGHYGPYDYVTERGRLEVVERFHFTPKIEALLGGESSYLGEDLSYTLNSSPNHHRALAAIMNLGARTNSRQPPHLMFSIECYFDRAVRFRPADTVVRALFGLYLAQIRRLPEAMKQLQAASHFAADNGLSHHNIGLTYFDLGLYEPALKEAHVARKLGFEGELLTEKLKSVNQWKDPAP